MTYAIIRHRLMDIRVVISRSLVYALLLALVTMAFVFVTFASAQFFGDTQASKIWIAFVVSALIVFGLEPMKRYIGHTTDRIFFKAPVDYQEVLRKISEKLSVEVELEKLIQETILDLSRELKLHHSEILLMDASGNLCRRDPVRNTFVDCVAKNTEFVHYLSGPRALERVGIDRSGLERKIEDTSQKDDRSGMKDTLATLERLGASFVVPITAQNKLNGALVLGRKLSGDAFSQEELRLFKVLGPQVGSAIEKGKLFAEVKTFTQKLQIEIDRATRELRDRNRYLGALQNVTSIITHSLDYKNVTQQIVDGIAKELGYVGGILILYDKKSGDTWAEAVTQTTLTRAAIKLLPRPVSAYHGSIHDVSKTITTIKTGTIQESGRFADFIAPAVPEIICDAIQKLTRIKHGVSVPIYSEEEIIGALVFGIGKPRTEITRQEIAMMKALADQAGIVMRNLRLFEAIQVANGQLETANDHLKALDEAKSEFISIASHQLRTPMTGIQGYLSMLLAGDIGKFDKKVQPVLELLLSQSRRMVRLINVFLNITKIEAGKFEIAKKPNRIEEIIDTEFTELQRAAKEKGITLKTKKPKSPLPATLFDRDKISDVIQNLVDNAIKYTEKGSVAIAPRIEDGDLVVSVMDTGRGLKAGEAERLFEKFVRGDGIARIAPDGSGLGLYIAKKIVEAHGGRIWVESEGEGKGSIFTFAIPVK